MTDALAKVKEYAATNPGVLLDAAGNVKDTGRAGRHSQG